MPHDVLWPLVAGLIALALGLWTNRTRIATAPGLEKLIALGATCTASALATFGVEHFTEAQFIVNGVPKFMPLPQFWLYFVAVALIAAALSLVFERSVRLSSTLLGVMFLIFVATLHLPNTIKSHGDRIVLAVALRDFSFAAGAFALAGTFGTPPLKTFGRIAMGAICMVFGVLHILHPNFAPGVPLGKITPDWFPLHNYWGYPVGAVLIVTGLLMLINRNARTATAVLGAVVLAITIFLYTPIFVMNPAEGKLEGLNYVFDTLLFAGVILLVARASSSSQEHLTRSS